MQIKKRDVFWLLIALVLAVVSYFLSAFSVSAAPVLLAMPPVVLPAQQIVFIRSLQEEYKEIDTWLAEAQDMSSFVVDGQTLRFPEAGAAPEVYKNKTDDVGSVEQEETVFDSTLDYYDSQNYKMRNINLHALPYDKIQYYTKLSADSIKRKEIQDAAYAFAPATAGVKRIVLPTTGPSRGAYKMLTLDDIVSLARVCDNSGFPGTGRNLVLPSDMWWDLVTNNDILKGQLAYQANSGVIDPKMVNYYGFKIHKSFGDNAAVAWDLGTGAKAPQGALVGGQVVPAGFVFVKSEVYHAGGSFEMFLKNKTDNPTGRATEFGFAHRFKADFTKSGQRYSALIYMALA